MRNMRTALVDVGSASGSCRAFHLQAGQISKLAMSIKSESIGGTSFQFQTAPASMGGTQTDASITPEETPDITTVQRLRRRPRRFGTRRKLLRVWKPQPAA